MSTTNEEQPIFDANKILAVSNRQKNATLIDKALGELNLGFYETLLGICDFMMTIYTLELSKALETQDAKKECSERMANISQQFTDILNKREAKNLGEEMAAITAVLTESVVIGVHREEMAIEAEKKQTEIADESVVSKE